MVIWLPYCIVVLTLTTALFYAAILGLQIFVLPDGNLPNMKLEKMLQNARLTLWKKKA